MAAWKQILGLLVLVTALGAADARANTTHAARTTAAPPTNQWMRTMESSVNANAVRLPDSRRDIAPALGAPSGGVMAWLGWIFAVGFFLVLMSHQLKLKRRERLLGGGPEICLIPPARNRRRRPR